MLIKRQKAARQFPSRYWRQVQIDYDDPRHKVPFSAGDFPLSTASNRLPAAGGLADMMISRLVIFFPYNSSLLSSSGRSVAPVSATPAKTPLERDQDRISADIF